VLWHCSLGGRKGIWPVKTGGWWRCALVSPGGVAPSPMVSVSASVNLPLHHKVQKFPSGTGSPRWSRKKGHKTALVCAVVCCSQTVFIFCCWGFFFFLFSSPILSGRRLDVYHTSTHDVALWPYNAGLKCAACGWLKIQDAEIRHLRTIAQLCRAISLQLRHISTIGKTVKQQCLPHMSSQYGELRPTSGWDSFVSLGHPS